MNPKSPKANPRAFLQQCFINHESVDTEHVADALSVIE